MVRMVAWMAAHMAVCIRAPTAALALGDALARNRALAAVALAAEQVGVAQQCLDLSVAYTQERQQFGRAVASFQAVKHKCAQMIAVTERATGAVWDAARALDEEADDPETTTAHVEFAAAVAEGGALPMLALALLKGKPLVGLLDRSLGHARTWMSDLLPHMQRIADDICIVKSMHTEAINHDPAITFINTCPATILAKRRTERLTGRDRNDTTSIMVTRGTTSIGTPDGTNRPKKWRPCL